MNVRARFQKKFSHANRVGFIVVAAVGKVGAIHHLEMAANA
jgi:hypothetical protein